MNINTLKFGFVVAFLVVTLSSLVVSAAVSTTVGKSLPDIPVRLIKQEYFGNEATIITIDLGPAVVNHSSLTLTTSDKNFSREVQIEGSTDNQKWTKFDGQLFIFDSRPGSGGPGSGLEKVTRDTTINYPETTDRYLRVTIYDRGEKPLIISGALAYRPVSVTLIATSTPQSVSSTTLPAPRTPFFENPFYLLSGLFILVVGVVGGLAFRLFRQTRV